MIKFNSSQRLSMLSSHLSQAMVLDGCEPPEIGTGFELLFGDYEFNPTKRDCDIEILAVVPKYIPNQGAFPLKVDCNPMTTVIYRRNSDGKVDYFNLSTYTKGSDGYGYKNNLQYLNLLRNNNFVDKNIQFQTSPAHKNGMYAMGVNAKVVYLSRDDVTEDAFVISKSFAKKLQSTAIRTINFQVGLNQIPLNLYGDESEYKFMPDIGENIRSDSIIAGFRRPDVNSFVSDTQPNALANPQPMHDILYFAQQPGGVIVDIDIYVNKKHKIPSNIFTQIKKYQDQNYRYHMAIVNAYNDTKKNGYQISEAFNTLVTRSYALLRADGRAKIPELSKKPNITLVQKKDPIEFLSITITYAYPNVVAPGYKITGRNGDKGVISAILPDEEMPVDAYGIRADIIVDPASVFNRMNPGQLNVQAISRMNQFIRWRVEHMLNGGDIKTPFTRLLANGQVTPYIPPVAQEVDTSTPYEFLMYYLNNINPHYAKLIRANIFNEAEQIQFLNQVVHEQLYLIMPPFLDHINPSWFLEMERKYPSPATPVTFITTRQDGSKKIDTTLDSICIGAKYVYCLYKIPHLKAAGPAYINQHKTPIHPSSHAKLQYPISQTPLKHGEDEIRNQTMAAGSAVTARMMALYANSTEGLNMLMGELLTSDHPTQLQRVNMTTRELINTNGINKIMQHLFSTFGVDILQQVGPGEPRFDFYEKEVLRHESAPQGGAVCSS